MKTKTFVLKILISALIFCTACSSNDGDSSVSQALAEQFTGRWKPVKFVTVCDSDSDVDNFSVCQQKGILTVNADGFWVETQFYEYIDNMCEEDGSDTGTWRITDGKLFVKESEFNESEITIFEISGTTLKVGRYGSDLICDNNEVSLHYYKEYTKI
jgi:hypothetical protein